MAAPHPIPPAGDSEMAGEGSFLPAGVTPEQVRTALAAILASPMFSQSRRLESFLRFVVDEALDGRAGELKEYLIGIEVFQRKRAYDPRTDPIVRVEAGRLRRKLAEYYETDGRAQLFRIDLPKGGYAPHFLILEPAAMNAEIAEPAPEVAVATETARAVPHDGRNWLPVLALAAIVAAGLGVYWAGRPDPARRTALPDAGTAPQTVSIAVLPFVDLSPGSDQAYFADGLTEELIDALTRVKGLRVAPRGPTARLTGVNRDVRQIGRELNVAAVLDGSVRKAGDRLRIAVRVSDVSKGYTLWAEMYERHVSDVFAVQEDISQKIVRSLGPQLGVAQGGRPIMRSGTTSLKAFNLYLKGRYHWNRRGEDSLRKAISYFEQAIQEDPRYAAAYSGLADAYGGLTHQATQSPGQLLSKDKSTALKALELDGELPEAHASLGRAQMFDDWDFAGAEKSLKRAMEIDPQYATAYQWYSVLLMLANRTDEALVHMRRAEELEPLHANIKRASGDLFYKRGDYDAAIQKCREAIELDGRIDSPYICLGRSFEQKGDYQQALDAYEKGGAVSKRHDLFVALKAHTQGIAGNRAEAKKLLEELRLRSQRSYVSPYYFAVASAGIRDRDQTLGYLEKALSEHSVWVIGMSTDIRFQFLRGDPRFAAIAEKLPALPRAMTP